MRLPAHSPSDARNVGSPLSALMPAPVSTNTRSSAEIEILLMVIFRMEWRQRLSGATVNLQIQGRLHAKCPAHSPICKEHPRHDKSWLLWPLRLLPHIPTVHAGVGDGISSSAQIYPIWPLKLRALLIPLETTLCRALPFPFLTANQPATPRRIWTLRPPRQVLAMNTYSLRG